MKKKKFIAPKTVLNEVGGAVKLCKHGYEGHCCCNCIHQLELFKHPMNRGIFEGSIMTSTKLTCCTVFSKIDKSTTAIIQDNKHGMCEEHWFRGVERK